MLNVRCWRSKQTPMLECGNAGFDPLRKSGGQKCCNAQHGLFDDVVGYDPRGLRKLMRRREFITLLGA